MGGQGQCSASYRPCLKGSVLEDFECPIGNETMIDPVMCADGFSYERLTIENWFSLGNDTSPVTGEYQNLELFFQ